jgi:hypothetical protein
VLQARLEHIVLCPMKISCNTLMDMLQDCVTLSLFCSSAYSVRIDHSRNPST